MQSKQVRTLRQSEAAYLAGLIDGEGTITLSRRHANERRQLVVSVVSTEREIVDWVLSTVGAGKITRKRTVAMHHSPSFTYTVANRQALAMLRQATPYLRSYKRARARLAIVHYVNLTPRNGKYSPEMDAARCQFEANFLDLKPRLPGD
jgi:3',5'-cyclic AMP phosphodiesterase CpdA